MKRRSKTERFEKLEVEDPGQFNKFEFAKQNQLTIVTPRKVLPLIILSQFACNSLWFAGNAILPELTIELGLSEYAISIVSSAVVLGFVGGTVVFAICSLADRYSPAKLFFISAIAGAVTNIAVVWLARNTESLFALRFLTGFFLAGIYPVGMKIAADWYEKGLGKALGFLVGALILGTAFPHLLKIGAFELPWKTVLYCTSFFALIGGILILFLGDGPYRKPSGRFQWNAIPVIFRSAPWRRAAFGYFGHMWELYSFWAFVPLMLAVYSNSRQLNLSIPSWSFLFIGIGSLTAIAGGYLSQRIGSAKVAFSCLLISFICCCVSPFIFQLPAVIFFLVLLIWGSTVATDSPQFSALVASNAPPHLKGTALTIYNSIGFLIAIVSLQVIDRLYHANFLLGGEKVFILLAIGPLIGLISFYRSVQGNNHSAVKP